MQWLRYRSVPLLVVLIIGLQPIPAHAEFGVQFQVGSQIVTFKDGDGNDLNSSSNAIMLQDVEVGDFTISVHLSTTNLTGTPTLAKIAGSSFTVKNNSTTSNQTLSVAVSATGFLNPKAPPAPDLKLNATLSASVEEGTLTGGSLRSFVFTDPDSQDGKFDLDFSGSGSNIVVSIPNNNSDGNFASTSQGYSVKKDLQSDPFKLSQAFGITWVGNFTLTSGGILTAESGNAMVTPLPGPGGLVLALVAVPFVGFVCLKRRFRIRSIPSC